LLKIFSTQLSGLFKTIQEKQHYDIEDGARLLAQAIISGGRIYLYGTDEMAAISIEATKGSEPLQQAAALHDPNNLDSITSVDRVLLTTRYSTDPEVLSFAKKLRDKGVTFVSISAHGDSAQESIIDLADVHIDLPIKKGLVPAEDGSRVGLPFSIAALFVYYGLKFTIDEILKELEEEDLD